MNQMEVLASWSTGITNSTLPSTPFNARLISAIETDYATDMAVRHITSIAGDGPSVAFSESDLQPTRCGKRCAQSNFNPARVTAAQEDDGKSCSPVVSPATTVEFSPQRLTA
jgi:hypothetical protein